MRFRFSLAPVSLLSAICLSAFPMVASAGDNGLKPSGDTNVGADGTDSTFVVPVDAGGGRQGGGGGGGGPVCSFERQPNSETFHMRRPNGGYYLMAYYRCGPGESFRLGPVVCVSECPAGEVPAVPPPPNPDDLVRELLSNAKVPVPRFAPPVERAGVKAITGLNLYFAVEPAMWVPITPQTVTAPGGWWASVTLTPITIGLDFDSMSATCAGPGPNPRSEEGRKQADEGGCKLTITDLPEVQPSPATLSIQWTAVIRSNVPGVPATGQITTSNVTNVSVKELQAVIVN